MRSRRLRHKHITCNSESLIAAKRDIKKFLESVLSQVGLRSGVDFTVTDRCLQIRHVKNVTGKILITLKELFPVFNYYWETPRILVWF